MDVICKHLLVRENADVDLIARGCNFTAMSIMSASDCIQGIVAIANNCSDSHAIHCVVLAILTTVEFASGGQVPVTAASNNAYIETNLPTDLSKVARRLKNLCGIVKGPQQIMKYSQAIKDRAQ